MFVLPLLAFFLSLAIFYSLARPRYFPREHGGAGKISVIIPARDEAENLTRLLPSLTGSENRPREIIVVDDQSSDETAKVAAAHGARVVRGKELPSGWKGKTWACQQGAEAASGEWLLFLDADLLFLPGALDRMAALTGQNAVSSVCPYHRVHRPYEQLSAYFNSITLAGVDAFALHPSREATLFGQVLLIHRDDYRRAGGHRAVRSEILENFRLARLLREEGVPIRHFLGRGQVEMRMFPEGLAQLKRSWRKGFLSGAVQAPRRALITTSLWLTGGMLLTGCLAATPCWGPVFAAATAISYLGYSAVTFLVFRLSGSFSFLTALFFPVPLLFYQFLFFSSLVAQKRGDKGTWKGRTLD